MPRKPSMIQLLQTLAFLLFSLCLAFPAFVQSTLAQPEHTKEHVTVILKDFHVHPNTTKAKAG